MSTSEKHTESDRLQRENDARMQDERVKVRFNVGSIKYTNAHDGTKSAEDRYTREVLSHAESIKTIDDLKQKLSTTEANARNNLSAAETAKANLLSSEASWKQQKEAMDKEIVDLKKR